MYHLHLVFGLWQCHTTPQRGFLLSTVFELYRFTQDNTYFLLTHFWIQQTLRKVSVSQLCAASYCNFYFSYLTMCFLFFFVAVYDGVTTLHLTVFLIE